jgi:undecaprenyl-diphosphatase
VQGITEFAPISSSGHLILVPWLFGWDKLGDPALNKAFDVALHMGTFVGAAVYFRRDIASYLRALAASIKRRRIEGADERIAWGLVIGTVPGAAFGALFSDLIEKELGQPWLIATMLAVFGVVLVAVDRTARSARSMEDAGIGTALFLGVAQAIALQPGVSRSGVTITAGRLVGLDRASAARFSFLLSLPVIGGAGVFKAIDVLSSGGLPPGAGAPFAWGFFASAVSGFLVVWWLLAYLRRHAFEAFLVYRLAVAALVLGLIAAGVRGAGF